MAASILTPCIALAITLLCAGVVIFRPGNVPSTLPWAGGAKSKWARWLANWTGMVKSREYMEEAHYVVLAPDSHRIANLTNVSCSMARKAFLA